MTASSSSPQRDMPVTMQAKILRALQERVVEPVGDPRARKVDVRVIAATNKDLAELVHTGVFRRDLYYRIRVVHLQLPPLMQRREDIPLLVEHFPAPSETWRPNQLSNSVVRA